MCVYLPCAHSFVFTEFIRTFIAFAIIITGSWSHGESYENEQKNKKKLISLYFYDTLQWSRPSRQPVWIYLFHMVDKVKKIFFYIVIIWIHAECSIWFSFLRSRLHTFFFFSSLIGGIRNGKSTPAHPLPSEFGSRTKVGRASSICRRLSINPLGISLRPSAHTVPYLQHVYAHTQCKRKQRRRDETGTYTLCWHHARIYVFFLIFCEIW